MPTFHVNEVVSAILHEARLHSTLTHKIIVLDLSTNLSSTKATFALRFSSSPSARRTRKKVTILGKDYLKTMEKEIDISQIPVQYGGRSERAIDDSDDERKVMTARIPA